MQLVQHCGERPGAPRRGPFECSEIRARLGGGAGWDGGVLPPTKAMTISSLTAASRSTDDYIMLSSFDRFADPIARRTFLARSGLSLGAMALGGLIARDVSGAAAAGAIAPLHHPPKAKRVIFLYMSGGPSQFETFDYKPKLAQLDGTPMPESLTRGQPIAQLQGAKLNCFAPQYDFARHGESGQEISSALPHIARIADKICIVRSLHTEAINHDPAHTFMNTGTTLSGRPSMGSWVWYGLGSESKDLPGFVVMTSFGGRSPQPIATRMWHNGFLPGHYQGVHFRSTGEPVLYLRTPPGVSASQQRDVVEAIQRLDAEQQRVVEDPEIVARIAQYEMAFRMQTSVPELMDFSGESKQTLERYGCGGMDGSFAANCLQARRLVERGVRFIQLYHRDWDHHNDVKHFVKVCAGHCDQASAALIEDLDERGLLDETLVIWGGEFGRTPMSQSGKGPTLGRDHHMKAFSMWLAGGGIKPGITYGSTDELGYNVAENPVHVRDLHATVLHQLGIDHERFTVKHQGLDWRLTGVEHARVVQEILT
jgi:hypothetical protein